MTKDPEVNDLMKSIAAKSLQVMDGLQNNPNALSHQLKQLIDHTEQFQSVVTAVLNNPDKAWEMQMAYWENALNLAQIQFNHWISGTPMPPKDRRFSGEEWLNNPFYNLLSHQYILASEHMNTLLQNIEYEEPQAAKRIQFFIKQYVDALSPTNFLHTNPKVMAETINCHGTNLLRGLNNLLTDLESGENITIKMTDMESFRIGENLATTPGKVIFRNSMMELIQYTPVTSKTKPVPLLIVPPWINKYYILDLSPQNSLVRWLVSEGISVFIISWVNPDSRFAQKGLLDYLEDGPRAAIKIIRSQLKCSQVNALGFCIGGTLLSMVLAYNKAIGDHAIKSATFLASMIDFSDPGDISVFIDEMQIRKLEQEMASTGYLPGKYMASSFNSLRANDLVWSFFIKNYLQGKDPAPFDILYWNSDCTNMPAVMHSQYLRWLYLENNLAKPGKIILNDVPLDITQVTTPTFFLSTEKDHIAPWKTTFLGFNLMKGEKRFVLGGSGHIAGIINSPSSGKYSYRTNESPTNDPEDWFKHSTEYNGSWWPEWLKWLKCYSGRSVAARKPPSNALMDAPGSYVFQK